jgi:hypothetical protein
MRVFFIIAVAFLCLETINAREIDTFGYFREEEPDRILTSFKYSSKGSKSKGKSHFKKPSHRPAANPTKPPDSCNPYLGECYEESASGIFQSALEDPNNYDPNVPFVLNICPGSSIVFAEPLSINLKGAASPSTCANYQLVIRCCGRKIGCGMFTEDFDVKGGALIDYSGSEDGASLDITLEGIDIGTVGGAVDFFFFFPTPTSESCHNSISISGKLIVDKYVMAPFGFPFKS